MKKSIPVILLLLSTLLLTNCKKDKDNEPADNTLEAQGSFTIDTDSYELVSGEMVYWGDSGGVVYYHNIILYSEGIEIDNEVGFTGEGSTVKISLASEQQHLKGLTTYSLTSDSALTMNQANVILATSYNPGNDLPYLDDYYTCTSGTLSFNESKGQYDITIDAVAEKNSRATDEVVAEGIEIEARFIGEIVSVMKK